MGATLTPVESTRETINRQNYLDIIRQYSNHLGLVAVALVVFVIARFGSNWNGVNINLPSIQVQVTLTPTPAPTGEASIQPTLIPTAIPDQTIRREVISHTYSPNLPNQHFIYHEVIEGDTPNIVAEEYGIEPATLLWGNPDLSNEAQLLQVGITLTILPIDGVLHTVEMSDTVDSLAEMYNVDPQVIIDYEDNNLKQWPHRPVPGTQLIIPGGEQSYLVWEYSPNSRQGTTTANAFYQGGVVYAGVGRFIWPTWGSISQYYWWGHRAIDIAAPIGRAISASDSGTVIHAGWNTWGYGNLVVLDHGNGFQTWYAHMNEIWVANGQFVAQGSNIGAVGTTGNSSGPHLHFEIRYGGSLLNPLDYLQ
jgi:hypothetical protein